MPKEEATKWDGTVDINTVFLFDIDGTLNEAQQPICPLIQQKLQALARHWHVYFATGNSYTKSVDMLGSPIGQYSGIFVNNADELRSMRGKLIWQDTETPPLPPNIDNQLMTMLVSSGSHYGNRIEWRSPRMVNYCEIGRYAPLCARLKHDASWRAAAVRFLSEKYPDIEVSAGGAVSIDIYSKGADKSRACKYFNALGKKVIFVGDKTDIHGNDYPVKKYTLDHSENICLTTTGVSNTLELLDGFLRSY